MLENPRNHTILVSGATGQQGGAVARHLLERGFRVRALTRDPDQEPARALAEEGAEVAEGNFDDRRSLDRALDGAYGAYSVQTFFEDGIESEIAWGEAFADAAADAGVRHFVYSSVAGADRETGIPHFESKWRVEEHIRSLDLPATILRPVSFMENWGNNLRDAILAGQLPQPLSPEARLQQIAVNDIGAFAAIVFADPEEWIDRQIELAGDETSMAETAETFARVLDRPVDYVQVPWDAFREHAGDEITTMYRWFEDHGYETDIEALREAYPPLMRLEPFLRTQDWVREQETEPQEESTEP